MLDERSGRLAYQCACNLSQVADLLGAVPYICIVQDRGQEEIEQHDHCKCIASDIERCHQRVSSIIDLGPVKADRQQAQTGVHLGGTVRNFTPSLMRDTTHSKQCVHFLVIGENPRDEGKRAETCPDIVWKPEHHKSKDCDVGKKGIPGDCPAICCCATFRLM